MALVERYVLGERPTAAVYAVSALALVPYSVYHLRSGDPWASLLALGVAVVLAACALLLTVRGGRTYVEVTSALGIISTNVAVVLVAARLGSPGAYWAYPVMVANFLVLTAHTALIVSTLQFTLLVLFLRSSVAAEQLVRIATTLPLCGLFTFVFSGYVRRQRDELARLATLDPLTGAGNRRALDRALEEAADRHRRYGEVISILLFDLDRFKEINDTYGHAVGDEVMVRVAACIQRRVRKGDGFFRYGGEEFVVLLPHTGLERAVTLAENLRAVVEEDATDPGMSLTVSAGAAELFPGESPREWLGRCDRALYQAKRLGRNRVEVATPPPGSTLRATSR